MARGIAQVGVWFKMASLPDISGTIFATENPNVYNTLGSYLGGRTDVANPYGQLTGLVHAAVKPIHGGRRFNYLFCDGHVAGYGLWDTVGTGGIGTGGEAEAKGMWTRAAGD